MTEGKKREAETVMRRKRREMRSANDNGRRLTYGSRGGRSIVAVVVIAVLKGGLVWLVMLVPQ